MVFGGLQKLTLLDYPDKTACTLFTVGCNFICPFCQNASLIVSDKDNLDDECGKKRLYTSDVLEFLEKRQGLLDGVCISGGEPLIREELEEFIDEVKKLGFLVKLDTNGSDPEKLDRLIKAGKIDYIAMDIKNSQEKYAQTIGITDYDISSINESINLLLSHAPDYEFRTTVVREFHDENDLISITHWIAGAKRYFLQKFTRSPGVLNNGLHDYSETEMQRMLSKVIKSLPITELRGV